MSDKHNLSASLEDYLEVIYQIEKEKQAARAKDIVLRTGVSNASVTGALRTLGKKGLINYAPYDLITLTPEGREYAESIIFRHNVLKGFLTDILLVEDEELADKTACQMEHALSGDIHKKIAIFLEGAKDSDWLKEYHKKIKNMV